MAPIRNSAQILLLALAAILLGLVVYNTLGLGRPRREIAGAGGSASPPAPAMPEAQRRASPAASVADKDALYRKLQEDGAAMGLEGVAPGEEDEAPLPFMRSQLAEPGTREQADAAMRELSALRQSADEAGGKRPAVPLEGQTPFLLSTPEATTGHFLLDSSGPAK